jgi:hypothetical protein
VDRLLDQADEALEAQDWQKALESAEVALNFDPANPDAQAFVEAARHGLKVSDIDQPEPTEGLEHDAINVPTEFREPISFASGRYEVKSLLGEGGKKKVYLAHDTTLDRDVAFGLIKAEAANGSPVRHRPWHDWATTLISCRYLISVKKMASPTWSSRSWSVAM